MTRRGRHRRDRTGVVVWAVVILAVATFWYFAGRLWGLW